MNVHVCFFIHEQREQALQVWQKVDILYTVVKVQLVFCSTSSSNQMTWTVCNCKCAVKLLYNTFIVLVSVNEC